MLEPQHLPSHIGGYRVDGVIGAWHADMKGRMEQVVLVRSRIVALLVRNADRLIGGGAEATADRDTFERAWAAEVARRLGRPSS